MTEVVVDVKRCPKCGEQKTLSQFHKAAKLKDGHQAHCKECRRPTRHVPPGWYQTKEAEQDGKCAICGVDPTTNTHMSLRYQRLQIDYAEGYPYKVRGLVCMHCLHNINLWDDNPVGLLRLYDHITLNNSEGCT